MSEHTPIPGYELLHLLARNGHLIYRARQSSTGRLVRLNVVHSSGEFGRHAAERLRREARALAGLDHPNIVRLIEVGGEQGCGFFSAREYIDGDSLSVSVMRAPLLHRAELVRIIRAVAAALDYAHGRNVVHGSLHPKHILLDRTGHIFLVGFGEVDPKCREGTIVGNPHFLAPEQLDGFDKTVSQSDVYALAEVAFLLLSGSYPFAAENIFQLLRRKQSSPAPSVRTVCPGLPKRVDRTLQRAMALRPENRFRSAGRFVEELICALHVRVEDGNRWWRFWR